MYLQIHTQITSVYVRKQIRANGSVVECGIEDGFVIFIIGSNINFR